jgi:DNA (cytosine-5)-methyltransferase 1
MDYVSTINSLLKPAKSNGLKVLDLFAGAGGMALGFVAHGFETLGYEIDADCCKTYEKNLGHPCKQVKITTTTDFPSVDVIIGGPPCQPFSVRGHQKGEHDDRNGFPAYIEAVKKIRPCLFVIENVKGILYKNEPYFRSIIKNLEQLGYIVEYDVFNAVYFSVPQKRERIVIVGHRGGFSFPLKLNTFVTAGEALGDLAYSIQEDTKFLTPNMEKYVAEYEAKSFCVTPRDLHLDRPARTLTCRNLAGATSDMHRIKLSDGRRRRITMREAARLQSFPDQYVFEGAETSVFNQIGNAVPPLFAFQLAAKVKEYFGLTLETNPLSIFHAHEQLSLLKG